MKFILILTILLFSNCAHCKTNFEDKYYNNLKKDEKYEVMRIKRNYHKYTQELRSKALDRYNQIKINSTKP